MPYLAALGISHLYASPITMARPGSMHGYDVVDFNRLNPELGGEEEFARLVETLHAHGMGLIVDFVPNHMGVGSGNPWWLDVLEWGQASPYAEFFDIDWEAGALGVRGKILLPVLGDHYGTLLEAGELGSEFDRQRRHLSSPTTTSRFPIAVRHYAGTAAAGGRPARRGGGAAARADRRLHRAGRRRATRAPRAAAATPGSGVLKAALAETAADPADRGRDRYRGRRLNGTPGAPPTFRMLDRLLEDQAYRLAYWRVASSEINYRRFFDINELAGLRMERPEVFEATHEPAVASDRRGRGEGVRLDHIDGLHDPFGYCKRLRRAQRAARRRARTARPPTDPAPAPIYIVVEKILAWHERLRAELPVAGTTGYDFMTWSTACSSTRRRSAR